MPRFMVMMRRADAEPDEDNVYDEDDTAEVVVEARDCDHAAEVVREHEGFLDDMMIEVIARVYGPNDRTVPWG